MKSPFSRAYKGAVLDNSAKYLIYCRLACEANPDCQAILYPRGNNCTLLGDPITYVPSPQPPAHFYYKPAALGKACPVAPFGP